MKKIYLGIFLVLFNCISVNAEPVKVESVEPTCEIAKSIVAIIEKEAKEISKKAFDDPDNAARNTVLASQLLGMSQLEKVTNKWITKNCNPV